MWPLEAFLALSLSIFALALLASVALMLYLSYHSIKGIGAHKLSISPFHIMTGGVFLSAIALLYPAVSISLGEDSSFFTNLLVSMQNTLQLFTIDADFGLVASLFEGEEKGLLYTVYTVYASSLHIIAPILTAGIVLSFFKNVRAFLRYYVFSLPCDLYVLSELNERSMALAENIFVENKKRRNRARIVFTDVFEQKEDEKNYELVQRAYAIGAILFAKDITQIRLRPTYGKKITRKVYLIGDNEDENIKQALNVISYCRRPKKNGKPSVYNTSKTEFYVFSRSAESEVLLNSLDNGNMKVRRIDENRNFVLRTLKEHPIFFDALPAPEGKTDKQLNIILVGLGRIGTEFVKALSWIGQMYGYELNLHIFDGVPNIEKRLRSIAPDLIKNNFVSRRPKRADEDYLSYYLDKSALTYRPRIDGEAYYNFFYYDKVDVKTQDFLDIVSSIGDASTVYVTLGDDELNIETAMRLRTQFERDKVARGAHIPSIFAVVYSEIKNAIISDHDGLRTFKDEKYDINIVGSLESSYTLDALEQENIEKAGLECHLKWSGSDEAKKKDTESYSKYEYYRRSSMAEALHAFLRGKIGLVPGEVDEKTAEMIYKYEHCRWCAFIRSEGYIYINEASKSDLAKTHKHLRPYDELNPDVRLLDQIVITELMGINE